MNRSKALNVCIPGLLGLALLVMSTPMEAQVTDDQNENHTMAQEVESAETDLPIGMEAGPTDGQGDSGQIYVAAIHGDWDVRCISIDEEPDPCQLYQLLEDEAGNPIAEINVFPVSGSADVVAGATVVTPLETLLTEGLEISVDGGEITRHPFLWCSRVGCVSRIALNQADLTAFRRGLEAKLSIAPAAAANRKVDLTISLTGFIAAFSDVRLRSES